MSATRFALISFLFLWGGSVRAQQGLVKDEQEFNRRKKQACITYQRIMSYTSRNDLPGRMPDLNREESVEAEYKSFDTASFALHVDESFFNSIIVNYNSSNFQKMLSENVHFDSPTEVGDLENHYKLFSKIYGVITTPVPISRELLSFRDRKFKLAFVTYRALLKGAEGELTISVNVTQKETPSFWALDFTSYDYSHSSFFLNISKLTFEYIKANNMTALKNDASKLFYWTHEKKIEKSLEALDCDSAKLFRSSLAFMSKGMRGYNETGKTYASVIYYLPKADKYLRLEFISEDNKFKLYDLDFLDKK